MKRAFLPGLILLAAAAPGLASAADLHGPDVAAMDSSVAPGNDFFAYGNGTWIKNTEIPPDRSAYGLSQILADQTTQRVSDILKNAAAHPAHTQYLFYVTDPNGCNELTFAKTEEEFFADAEKYEKAREKNGGNQPSNCK